MKPTAILCMATMLAACGGQRYLVRSDAPVRSDDERLVVGAVRERDGAAVGLQASTIVRDGDQDGVPAGTKRVRGNWRRNPKWNAGLGMLIGGTVGFLTGLFVTLFAGCIGGDGPGCASGYGDSALIFGITISAVSDVSMLIIGPTLLGVGAGDYPREVRGPALTWRF